MHFIKYALYHTSEFTMYLHLAVHFPQEKYFLFWSKHFIALVNIQFFLWTIHFNTLLDLHFWVYISSQFWICSFEYTLWFVSVHFWIYSFSVHSEVWFYMWVCHNSVSIFFIATLNMQIWIYTFVHFCTQLIMFSVRSFKSVILNVSMPQ